MGPCSGRQISVSRWQLRQLGSEGCCKIHWWTGTVVSAVTCEAYWFTFFFFHRIQSRIGSPVSPQHTGSSRTVRRYPASNGQLTSNALPNGNGHEQSSPHAVSQEHTLSAKGKACRAVTLLEFLVGVMGKANTMTRDPQETMDSQRSCCSVE